MRVMGIDTVISVSSLKISKSILSPHMSTLPHLITNLNARPHNLHRKDVDALLQSFDLIKSFYFWYGNVKVQRLGSVKTSALSSHLIIFSVSVKVNSTSKSKLSIGSTIDAHEPKVQFIHLFMLVIVCLGKSMFAVTSNEPITVTMSLSLRLRHHLLFRMRSLEPEFIVQLSLTKLL